MFENIGRVLRELRLRRRLQQQELAAQAGVDKGAMSRWEAGKVTPSLRNLDLLLDTLGVEPAEFIQTCEDVDRLEQAERETQIPTTPPDPQELALVVLLEEQIGRLVELKQQQIDQHGDEAETAWLTEGIERLKRVSDGVARGTLSETLAEIGAEQRRKVEQEG